MKSFAKYFVPFSILTLVLCLLACNKKAVHKVDEDFIGRWKHFEHDNESWYIQIGDNSYGSVTLYDSLNEFIAAYGENPKRWRLNNKRKTLNHGLYNATFQIDQYPTIATGQIVNGIDTVLQGETYVILDGDYFVKY